MVNVLEGLDPEPVDTPSNVTPEERAAIKQLKENKNIVIKEADKTNVFVIMDTYYYRDKLVLQDHLNTSTYERTTEDADKNIFSNQTKLMKKHEKCLTPKEFNFITNYEWKTFTLIPKFPSVRKLRKGC